MHLCVAWELFELSQTAFFFDSLWIPFIRSHFLWKTRKASFRGAENKSRKSRLRRRAEKKSQNQSSGRGGLDSRYGNNWSSSWNSFLCLLARLLCWGQRVALTLKGEAVFRGWLAGGDQRDRIIGDEQPRLISSSHYHELHISAQQKPKFDAFLRPNCVSMHAPCVQLISILRFSLGCVTRQGLGLGFWGRRESLRESQGVKYRGTI